jgi:hypothetical protein
VQHSYVSTSHNRLKVLGDALTGEWTGEVTLAADEQPFGKKGDKLEGHTRAEWIFGGADVSHRHDGGQGHYRGSNQIVSHMDSEAGLGSSVYAKQGGKWIAESSSAAAEGSKHSSRMEIAIEDNGNRLVYRHSPANVHDVWRRVK